MTRNTSRIPSSLATRLAAAIAFVVFVAPVGIVFAAPKARVFPKPEKGVEALVKALRADDIKELLALFGPEGASIVESGDPVRDQNDRKNFLAAFDEKNNLRTEGENATIVIGANDWPFPIPIVKGAAGWQFDAAAGREEILNRRIGKNELGTIQTLLDLVDAQRAYYAMDLDDDGLLEFATKIRSSLGRHDGLFWPAKEGEPESPLHQPVADAMAEGYTAASPSFHGYHYRILTAQGARAPGGEYDYLVRENLIGGFAFVAWPAEWGDSGVMTFLVSHGGTIYQKDLGKETEAEVAKITIFDPGDGWNPVDEKDLAPVE